MKAIDFKQFGDADVLERWHDQFERGSLVPVVDTIFPLAHATDAHRRMESNQSVGKIILAVRESGV